MNIFYLDPDPIVAAKYHVDKHCVKMILESAQLMSTAHHVLDGEKNGLYKKTHVNHPSAIWARKSDENYKWLYRLFEALLDEYEYRYGKIHKSSEKKEVLKDPPKNIPKRKFTEPTPAMPDQYITESNSVVSYRKYYVGEKNNLFSWKDRETPEWIKEYKNEIK